MQQVINSMRRQTGWHAVKSEIRGKVIVARQFGVKYPKFIQFILTYSKGKYLLEHPNYEYVNRVAHFRSIKKEIRLSLNKTYLASVIGALRNAGVWPLILNQDFLKVNNRCKKSNKGKVEKELANLLL